MFAEIYYWTYFYARKFVRPDWDPAESAYLMLAMVQMQNIVMLGDILGSVIKIKVDRNLLEILVAIVALIIMFLNYLFHYRHRDEICRRYDVLTLGRRKKGKIFFWSYVVISEFLFFFLVRQLALIRG